MGSGASGSAVLLTFILVLTVSGLAGSLVGPGYSSTVFMYEVTFTLESRVVEGYSVWLVSPVEERLFDESSEPGSSRTYRWSSLDFELALRLGDVDTGLEPSVDVVGSNAFRFVFDNDSAVPPLAVVRVDFKLVQVTTTTTVSEPLIGLFTVRLLEARVPGVEVVDVLTGTVLLGPGQVGGSAQWSGDPLVGLGVRLGGVVYPLGSEAFVYTGGDCSRIYEMDADGDGVYGEVRVEVSLNLCPTQTTTSMAPVEILYPPDGEVVGATSLVVRWRTAEPLETVLEVWGPGGVGYFETGRGVEHSALLEDLEPGAEYRFRVVAGDFSTGWYGFRVAEGLLLGVGGAYARIARDYGQYVPVTVVNRGSLPASFRAAVRGLPPGVVGGFVGEGGEWEANLVPGESVTLMLGLHAPEAVPGTYTVEVYLVSGGEEVASAALFIEIVGTEPRVEAEYSRVGWFGVITVRNTGVVPVNGLSIRLAGGLEGKAYIQPSPVGVRLEPGEERRFRVYPVLHEGFIQARGVAVVSYVGGGQRVGVELGLPEGYRVGLVDPLDMVEVSVLDPVAGDYYTSPSGTIEPLMFPDGTVAAPVSLGFKVVLDLGNETWPLSWVPLVVEVEGTATDGSAVSVRSNTTTGPGGAVQVFLLAPPGTYRYRALVPGTGKASPWTGFTVAGNPMASVTEDAGLALEAGGETYAPGRVLRITREATVVRVPEWGPGYAGLLVLYRDGTPAHALPLDGGGAARLDGVWGGSYEALLLIYDGSRIRYASFGLEVEGGVGYMLHNSTRTGFDVWGRLYVLDQVVEPAGYPLRVEARYVVDMGNVTHVYVEVASERVANVTVESPVAESYTVEAGPAPALVGPFTVVPGNFTLDLAVSSGAGEARIVVGYYVVETVDPDPWSVAGGYLAAFQAVLNHPVTNALLSCLPGLGCGFNLVVTGIKLGQGAAGWSDALLTVADCAEIIPTAVSPYLAMAQCAASVPPMFVWLSEMSCSDVFCINVGTYTPRCPFEFPDPYSPDPGMPPLPPPPPWPPGEPPPQCDVYCDTYRKLSRDCVDGNVTACYEARRYYSLCYTCRLSAVAGLEGAPAGVLGISMEPRMKSSVLYGQQVYVAGRLVAEFNLSSTPGPVYAPLSGGDLEGLGNGTLLIVNRRLSPGSLYFAAQIDLRALAYPAPFYAVLGPGFTAQDAVRAGMVRGPDLAIASGDAVASEGLLRFWVWNLGSHAPYAVVRVSVDGSEKLLAIPGVPAMSGVPVEIRGPGIGAGARVEVSVEAPGEVDWSNNGAVIGLRRNQPPTALLEVEALGGGAYVFRSASVDDGVIVAQAWDLGDGTLASGAWVEHVYAANGTYTVSLHVMDDYGKVSVATATVSVGAQPPATTTTTPPTETAATATTTTTATPTTTSIMPATTGPAPSTTTQQAGPGMGTYVLAAAAVSAAALLAYLYLSRFR